MKNRVLIGLQWGDEGKGKIIDVLSEDFDIIVRFQGGNNAGHTVVIDGQEFILHLIPSGIFRPQKICLIGNGVVVNPENLIHEMVYLKEKGITVKDRLFISSLCHVVLPHHWVIDEILEEKRGKFKIGTTHRGIGPCYLDKYARTGIRIGDLLDKEYLEFVLTRLINEKNKILASNQKASISIKKTFQDYWNFGQKLKPFIADISLILDRSLREKKSIFFEGAQGTFLDIDFGTYPYVTSSSPIAGGACVGSGIGPTKIAEVLGVTKAYTTRVGSGPFPTEFDEELNTKIQIEGKEFGATTGRKRRCGWLDLVMLRYALRVNGLTQLVVTKMDILSSLSEIKICTSYRWKGKELKEFPLQSFVLEKVEPIYESFQGWKTPVQDLKKYEELPSQAQKYLQFIEKSLGVPIIIVSVGPQRDQCLFCSREKEL